MSNNLKKILIVGSTHGHERVGLKIIEELKKLNLDKNLVDFEIGNPRASEKNIPFIESDLNRIFPGKEHGTYEEMRAYELSPKIKEAELVIDIHSTNTTDLSDESMLIVTNYTEASKEIIGIIKPPKVLYMKYKGNNALISQAKVGIAFEYGKDTSEVVLMAILHDIVEVLIHCGILKTNPYTTTKTNTHTDTEIFEVYDAFKKEFVGPCKLMSDIKNFQMVKQGQVICEIDMDKKITADEDFVPILFGENRYTEILGFKAKKI